MIFKKTTMILGCAILMGTVALSAQIKIKNNDKIAFMGDSITQFGHNYPAGYVNMVMIGLKVNGVDAKMIKAGISGHKSNNMLARLDRDVIKKAPHIMTLSCGVNDVWHGPRGVKLEDYKKNIRALVDKALAANIQVYILASTMVTENPQHKNNLKLDTYNQFLKELAMEKKLTFIDLNTEMKKRVAAMKAKYPGTAANFLTADGVHMDPLGNMMMAEMILKSFGLNDQQIAKAEKEWMKLYWNVRGIGQFKVQDYNAIQAKLWSQKKNMSGYCKEKLMELK